jgi:hypothetical protein
MVSHYRRETAVFSIPFSPRRQRELGQEELEIMDTANSTPHVITLSGIGTPTSAFVSPQRVDFGSWPVGDDSAVQLLTLANGGNTPLVLRLAASQRLRPDKRLRFISSSWWQLHHLRDIHAGLQRKKSRAAVTY